MGELSKKDGVLLSKKFHCISLEVEGKDPCSSSDAMAIYEHDNEDGVYYDSYCFSCNQSFNKEQLKASSVGTELGLSEEGSKRVSIAKAPKQEPLTKDQFKQLISSVGFTDQPYRSLKPKYLKFFGHLVKRDSKGNPTAVYYPETEDNTVTGCKIRLLPKSFSKIGKTGLSSQLSGQIKFKGGGKFIVITGGENDKVATFQALAEYQESRGQADYEPIAVVSATCGEGNAAKQCAAEYDFLDGYEYILVAMDNDAAGKEATKAICNVLPKEKIKVITWSGKDPHAMLEAGKERQIVRDFYNAKEFVPSGIKGSGEILDDVREHLLLPKVSLPDYMHRLQENMRGGIAYGRIVNIIANTSVGKSSHINNLVYHWIFDNKDPVGIISLEATAAEYALEMISIHLEKNLAYYKTGQEVLEIIDNPDVADKIDELFNLPDGRPRFYIVDQREGNIKTVEKQVERMFKQYGTKRIVIDVLSDLLRSLDNSEQEKHMMFQKMFVKNGPIIVNALHTRKPPSDKEGQLRLTSEFDALGSSSFIQSAHINIVFDRDKMSEDIIEKNTTIVRMPKCRGGITGDAGKWFYDYKTRKVYDLQDWQNGDVGVSYTEAPPDTEEDISIFQ